MSGWVGDEIEMTSKGVSLVLKGKTMYLTCLRILKSIFQQKGEPSGWVSEV